MRYREFGDPTKPTVVLLHGAGLSWWAYRDVIPLLQRDYRIILPSIDGYGDAADQPFESIQASARGLIGDLRERCRGSVFAVGGLSLGAQIAVEAIAQAPELARCAVLESALVCPIPGTEALTVPLTGMSYGLLKRRWFARLQAKALFVPDDQFEEYFRDSLKITRQTLVNTLRSNGAYTVPEGLAHTKAKTLIIVGEKEVRAERQSARVLEQTIHGSRLFIAPGMKHGELSLRRPEEYVQLLTGFFNGVREGEPNDGQQG
ncbi:MAG: alpha/beta hydrolase [Eubacteriales bacterium]|nr:alpha/beta hydrolase [Eubacteriales bacterium]